MFILMKHISFCDTVNVLAEKYQFFDLTSITSIVHREWLE